MVKDFFSDEKKIYDSVHGFIRLDEFEKEFIDSAPFQRLHYIHQLGISFLVYPGSTHTRFEHSLGVMELATKIYHNISKSVRPDIFHHVPRKGSVEYHYWRRVLRFAALSHDLGHLPFSHVAENVILKDGGHEEWTLKILESAELKPFWDRVIKEAGIHDLFPDRNFVQDIAKVAIGEKKWQCVRGGEMTPWEKVISEIVTGDFFGADRIDYLIRDSKSTGVAYGLFDYHQLIEMIRILPSEQDSETLSLGINENGIESCEALLLARHFMHRRVYQYSTVKAYNFHLSRFMQIFFNEKDFKDVESFLRHNDAEVIQALHAASRDPLHPGHSDAARIINRKNRFRALALTFDIPESELEKIRLDHAIPEHAMSWEIHPLSQKVPLSFPVSRQHLTIESAGDISDLLTTALSKKSSWIYVSPDYELALTSALEQYRRKE